MNPKSIRINVRCGACGGIIKADTSLCGQKIPCLRCGHPALLPPAPPDLDGPKRNRWALGAAVGGCLLLLLLLLVFGGRGLWGRHRGRYDASFGPTGPGNASGTAAEHGSSRDAVDTGETPSTEPVPPPEHPSVGQSEPSPERPEILERRSSEYSSQVHELLLQAEVSSSPAGGAAPMGGSGTGFFGIRDKGSDIVFVVDRSGSMRRKRMDLAKEELIKSIKSLTEQHRFYIIFFSSKELPMPFPAEGSALLQATAENKQKAIEWANSINATGGTQPLGAMKIAIGLNPDAIFLLSDGVFAQRIAQQITELNSPTGVRIHTIAFFSRSGEEILRELAEDNNGLHRFVEPY